MANAPVSPLDLALPTPFGDALHDSRQNRIVDHGVDVDVQWWNSALHERGLPGGPLLGSDPIAAR